jgi:hypothetical protein
MTVQVIVSTSYFFVMYREIKVKNDVCYRRPNNSLLANSDITLNSIAKNRSNK